MATNEKILLDADFLIALWSQDDSNNKKALEIASKLSDCFVCMTQFTVAEIVTVISKKWSQSEAVNYLKSIRERKYPEVEITQDLVDMTDELFMKQKKKGTSWIDCYNAVICKKECLNGIASFDKFYSRVGVKVVV
jgi:predicted nucleic acid-binding protein